jgi:hypothetical protein
LVVLIPCWEGVWVGFWGRVLVLTRAAGAWLCGWSVSLVAEMYSANYSCGEVRCSLLVGPVESGGEP